jgi:hypothetical protein
MISAYAFSGDSPNSYMQHSLSKNSILFHSVPKFKMDTQHTHTEYTNAYTDHAQRAAGVSLEVTSASPSLPIHATTSFSPESPPTSVPKIEQSPDINRMTLELLVNKRQYRKYLEKTNTSEHAHKREHYSRFCKYKYDIAKLLDDLLNDYSISGNSAHLGNVELQDIFEAFIQKSTLFFMVKEQEIYQTNHPSENQDTDVLFENVVDDIPDFHSDYAGADFNDDYTDRRSRPANSRGKLQNTLYPSSFVNIEHDQQSFWGKNIVKRK